MSHPAVVFGGPSPEHDVSVLTGLQAARALTRAGYAVEAVYWSKSAAFYSVDPGGEAQHFLEGVPKGAKELRLLACPGGGLVPTRSGLWARERPLDVSAVVNCCHGGPGEDGTLQAAFDLAGLAYTGPTAAGAALGMDKLALAGAAAQAGLPVLPRWLIDGRRAGAPPAKEGPFIVKPRFGGSSIGIEVVADWDTAVTYAESSVHLRRGAVVEPYLASAFDLNVAVRSWPQLQLSAVERPLRTDGSTEILGYGDKYLRGGGMDSAPRQLPAEIPPELESAIRDAAATVATVARVRGVARCDFLVDGSHWYVNEVNTIPGSLARYLWVGPGAVDFTTLLTDMLDEAARDSAFRYDATGADGTALRSASSIASKLG